MVAESSGRMPDCLSGGTGSTPVATAIGVRTRREGRSSPKRVQAGSNPVTPASLKSEHGIAAGASGLQPDDASSTLAARSKISQGGSRLVAKTRRCQRRERGFESRLPLQVSKSVARRCSQDSKASPCKGDHRECNSPRHLQSLRWCSSVGRARAS